MSNYLAHLLSCFTAPDDVDEDNADQQVGNNVAALLSAFQLNPGPDGSTEMGIIIRE
jgi:hypothetical protein